jgi:hypothetical protein
MSVTLLVPLDAPKNIAALLWQAVRDNCIENENDAAAVWKELVAVAAIEVPENHQKMLGGTQPYTAADIAEEDDLLHEYRAKQKKPFNPESCIGLNANFAIADIRSVGLEPRVYHKDDMRMGSTLPSNVVEINYDDNKIVVSAYTQKSIDQEKIENNE